MVEEKTMENINKLLLTLINVTMIVYMIQMINSMLKKVSTVVGGEVSQPVQETVLLADDFNDNSIDTNKWQTLIKNGWGGNTPSGTATIQESEQEIQFVFSGSSYQARELITKNAYVLSNHYIEARNSKYWGDGSGNKIAIADRIGTDLIELSSVGANGYVIGLRTATGGINKLAFHRWVNGIGTQIRDDEVPVADPRKIKIEIKDGKIRLYYDSGGGYVLYAEDTYAFPNTPMYIFLYSYSGAWTASGTSAWDDFKLVQYG